VTLQVTSDPSSSQGIIIKQNGSALISGEAIPAPGWYGQKVGKFDITQIITAHNRQLATAVYEDCVLFGLRKGCQFCVMNCSQQQKDPALIRKSAGLILSALEKIPVQQYGGLTLNGGMTLAPGRGLEIFEPVARQVKLSYPDLPIAVEITPPQDLVWIDRLADAGVGSLMMNLETWDLQKRREVIPGKNEACSRDSYLKAFERAVKVLGPGKVSTCIVVGTEPLASLRDGIKITAQLGVIPSPLAGRYFEDIPDYPFKPDVDWRDFLEIIYFTAEQLHQAGCISTDKAGCVACGMCDLIKDATR